MGGGHDAAFEEQVKQELLILKGSQLVEAIGDQPVSSETILRAIHYLNMKGEKELMKRVKTITVEAADPKHKFKTQLFCEDSRLSLSVPGFRYQALDLDDTTIPILTRDDLQSVIDVAASFMDFSKFDPGSKGPALRKAFQAMQIRKEAPAIKDAVRGALSNF